MASKLNNIGIISVGSGLGEYVQSNDELEKYVKNYDADRSGKTLDTWIKGRYGIKSRVKTQKLPSDLAIEAVGQAVAESPVSIEEIDFLILNTATGDHRQPTTATEVQTGAGMRKDTFALEINMPCAGVLYGMAVAKSMIESGFGRYALVVGVDKMSDLADPEDFIMSGMFGDGAGACVIGPEALFPIERIELGSQRDDERTLCIPAGGSVLPTSHETVDDRLHFLKMKGKATSAFIGESITGAISKMMRDFDLQPGNIEQVIPHQASKPIVMEALHGLGFTDDQVSFSLEHYGNTSAASIFVTFQQYLANRSVQEQRHHVILVGMGGGLNWGGALLRINN